MNIAYRMGGMGHVKSIQTRKQRLLSTSAANLFHAVTVIHCWNIFWHLWKARIEALSQSTNAHSIQKNGRCTKRKWNNPSYLYIKMSTEQTPEAHVCWKANTWYLCGCWCNDWALWNRDTLQTLWQSQRRRSTSPSETEASFKHGLKPAVRLPHVYLLLCFGVTCRVLEISAIETSAFSPV